MMFNKQRLKIVQIGSDRFALQKLTGLPFIGPYKYKDMTEEDSWEYKNSHVFIKYCTTHNISTVIEHYNIEILKQQL